MNLAQQLKALANSSKEERIKVGGQDCADFLRNKAKLYALKGLTSYQIDDFNHYQWNEEEVKYAIDMLTQEGFWCVSSERAIGVSWGHAQ